MLARPIGTRNTRLTCWQAAGSSGGLLCGALGFFTLFALFGLLSIGGFCILVSRLSFSTTACHAAHVLLIVLLVLLQAGNSRRFSTDSGSIKRPG